MGRADGKVVIITGGAMGLGEADARRIVEEGGQVTLADINEEVGAALASELGDAALFVKHDVTDEASWQNVIAKTVANFGKLDGLVNNAGLVTVGTVEDVTLDQWRKLHAVNVDGVFLGCKYAVAEMKKNGSGSIVNMSSAAGLRASANLTAYNSSKAAVAMMTKSVALHAAQYGIRCNSVHPGMIRTPMVEAMVSLAPDPDATFNELQEGHALARHGQPIDIANIVLYLIGDESAYATGGEFTVDGGLAL